MGEELIWLDGMVRSRASAMADDTAMRDLAPTTPRSGAETGAWIVGNASSLVEALREAGPDASMWNPLPTMPGTVAFFARRFAHETLMHRTDAALPLGATVVIAPEVARDALAEWMELGGLPEMLVFHPHRRELLGPGRTLRVGEWFVDLTGEVMVHRQARPDDEVAVTVDGPAPDLLLYLYRRADERPLTVTGDRALLAEWVAANGFA
ncbi:maleylpyruvate isomerase family mycothiol-dependent enzyme [Actinomycetospora sp. OC33-EN08]|uniref:Maleylpyruvate isomerase family mycothiol-dependent enzyme n=1 Tax=Actinomycetospora aurantiaca TaxID=3129233 RepID=A0ABU8MK51_9PSEU